MHSLPGGTIESGVSGGIGDDVGRVRESSDSCYWQLVSVGRGSNAEQLEQDIRTLSIDPVAHGIILGTGIR